MNENDLMNEKDFIEFIKANGWVLSAFCDDGHGYYENRINKYLPSLDISKEEISLINSAKYIIYPIKVYLIIESILKVMIYHGYWKITKIINNNSVDLI